MSEQLSQIELLASLPEGERKKVLDERTDEELLLLYYDWRTWARPKQIPPEGSWYIWLLLAGRGFGKTRTGAGFMQERAIEKPRSMAFVARTPADARDFMIEGPGGILRNTHPSQKPLYEPSKRRLTWPNGSVATIYSDDEPDQLRGFGGDTAWIDEMCKFKHPQQTWDNLQFGMREASGDPKVFISTTPKPIKILNDIKSREDCVTVIGSSYENRTNLNPIFITSILKTYEGTRLGRQEIYAEILSDNPDALWKRAWLDKYREVNPPPLVRIGVAIDPQAKNNPHSSETGMIVGGVSELGEVYILDDISIKANPDVWAKEAVAGYHKHKADFVIGETNNGGDMVEYTMRTIEKNIPFVQVHASRGKYVRAEPVALLYEQGKIHHVGNFPDLEDQLCEWVPGEFSPDRLDALVWLITKLLLERPKYEGTIIYDDPVSISKY